MKKILITLLALAGIAQASVVSFNNINSTEDIFGITNNNGTITPNKGNYFYITYYGSAAGSAGWPSQSISAISFSLNLANTTSASDNSVLISATNTSNQTIDITLGELKSHFSDQSGSFCIVFNGTSTSIYNSQGESASIDDTFTSKLHRISLYTLSTDLIYAASILCNQGGAEYFDLIAQVGPEYPGDEAIATSLIASTPFSPAVPEPTTATLSLLALAGLAARRRRA